MAVQGAIPGRVHPGRKTQSLLRDSLTRSHGEGRFEGANQESKRASLGIRVFPFEKRVCRPITHHVKFFLFNPIKPRPLGVVRVEGFAIRLS